MREIDQDPLAVTVPDQIFAKISQAFADIGRAGIAERNTMGKNIVAAPDWADRSQSGLIQHIQHQEIGVNGFSALDMENGSDLSGCDRFRQVDTRAYNHNLASRLFCDAQ